MFCLNKFIYLFKNKIILHFMIFVASKNCSTKKIFSFFCCYCWIKDPRSGIRDPGWIKIRNRNVYPGSATQHFINLLGAHRIHLLYSTTTYFFISEDWRKSSVAWIRITLQGRIRIHIKVIWIRICINLQMTSQNAVLRIDITLTGRIRIPIKLISWILDPTRLGIDS